MSKHDHCKHFNGSHRDPYPLDHSLFDQEDETKASDICALKNVLHPTRWLTAENKFDLAHRPGSVALGWFLSKLIF